MCVHNVTNQGQACAHIVTMCVHGRDIRDYVVVPHNIAPEGAHQVIE